MCRPLRIDYRFAASGPSSTLNVVPFVALYPARFLMRCFSEGEFLRDCVGGQAGRGNFRERQILLAMRTLPVTRCVSEGEHTTRRQTENRGASALLVLCHSLIFGLDISRNALASGSTGASALRLIGLTRILGCDRALGRFVTPRITKVITTPRSQVR